MAISKEAVSDQKDKIATHLQKRIYKRRERNVRSGIGIPSHRRGYEKVSSFGEGS